MSASSMFWGNFRHALHAKDWRLAQAILYNVAGNGEADLLEEMVPYYISFRDRAPFGSTPDALNLYSAVNRFQKTHKTDLALRLSTGVIWSDTPAYPASGFWSQIPKARAHRSLEEWKDWCVGRDTLIVNPSELSESAFDALELEGFCLKPLVKTVHLIRPYKHQISNLKMWMPFAEIKVEG